jgi:hypothetical protein
MVYGFNHRLVREKRLLFVFKAKMDRIDNQILNVEAEYISSCGTQLQVPQLQPRHRQQERG